MTCYSIAVWGPFERATGYVILTEITERRCGQTATDVLGTAPFVLGDKNKLADLLQSAGINEAGVILLIPNYKDFTDRY